MAPRQKTKSKSAVPSPSREPRLLTGADLFCGPGGFTLGMKIAGVETLCAVDKNADAISTFTQHTPDADHYRADIREVCFRKYANAIDVVYGGPPCQPFSTGGLRKGASDSRNMLPAFLEVVSVINPTAVVMENVPGLAVKSRRYLLDEMIKAISDLGYRVNWQILNAAEFGVPQKRRRLFIVGLRSRRFWFPRPTHGPKSDLGSPLVSCGTIVSHAPIGEPPNCPVKFAKFPDLRPSPYAGHIYNGGGRPLKLSEPSHTILASAGGYKTHWVDTQGVAERYHRHLVSGGPSWEGEVPGARRLTVAESALLQTFPDTLVFSGSRSSQYTQVGDAVPPVLAEILGSALVSQLNGDKPSEDKFTPPATQHMTLW